MAGLRQEAQEVPTDRQQTLGQGDSDNDVDPIPPKAVAVFLVASVRGFFRHAHVSIKKFRKRIFGADLES